MKSYLLTLEEKALPLLVEDPTLILERLKRMQVFMFFSDFSAATEDQWEQATVPRSGFLEKEVVVTQKNSIIFWEFKTEDHDVG